MLSKVRILISAGPGHSALWGLRTASAHKEPVLRLWDSSRWLCGSIACFFLWMTGTPWCGWTAICLTISPVEGHLSCFQFFAIMNKAAMNIHIHIHIKLGIFYIPINKV